MPSVSNIFKERMSNIFKGRTVEPAQSAFEDVEGKPAQLSDDPPKKLRRYCGNRLSRRQYICSWILGVNLLLTIIFLPLGYFVIVPAIIKRTFATAQPDLSANRNIALDELNLKAFTPSGLELKLAGSISNTKLPVSFLSGGIDPTTFRVIDADSGKGIVELSYSDAFSIDGKSDLKFSQETISLSFPDPENTRAIVNKVFTAAQRTTSIPPLNAKITGTASITLIGIKFKDIALERTQSIDLTSVANLARNFTAGAGNAPAVSGAVTGNSTASFTLGPAKREVTLFKRATDPSSAPLSVNVALNSLEITVDERSISTTVTGGFTASQPITLAIGRLSLMTTLASQDLANLEVSGLSLSKAANDFKVKLDVKPVMPANPTALQDVVKRLTGGGSVNGITAGVRNISLTDAQGNGIRWLNTILSGVDLNADLGALQKNLMVLGGGAGSSTSLPAGLTDVVKIQNVDVTMEANNTISINPTLRLKPPFDAKINIAPISGRIATTSAAQLLSFNLPSIQINGTNEQTLSLPLRVTFANTPEAQRGASQVAQLLVANQMPSLQLGGIQLGGNGRSGTGPSVNDLASIISFTIPLDATKLSSTSAAPPAEKMSAQPPSSSSAPIISDFTLRNASFSLTQTGFDLGLDAQLSQSLPVKLSVPFAALRVGVDESDLVGVKLNGLAISQGSQPLNFGIKGTLANDPTVGTKLTDILNAAYSGNSPSKSKLILQGISFGTSENEAVKLFDGLNVALPLELLKSAASPGAMNSNGGGLSSIFGNTTMGNISLSAINPSLRSASVAATADGLSIGAGTDLTIPLPVSVSAPFISVDLLSQDNRLVSVSLQGLQFQPGKNNLNLALGAKFSGDDAAAKSAAVLANSILSGKVGDAQVSIAGIKFGSDEASANQVFSALKLPVPVGMLASVGGNGGTTVLSLNMLFPNVTISADAINPQVNGLSVATLANGISLSPSVALTNPLPISVSMPFAALTVSINNAEFVTSNLQGLNLTSGQNSMDLTLSTGFGKDPAVAGDVKQLFEAFQKGGQGLPTLSVTGLRFGMTEAQSINTLAAVVATLPSNIVSAVLGENGTATNSLPAIDKIFPALRNVSIAAFAPEFRGADFATTPNGLNLGATAGINNILPVSLNFGSFKSDISLASTKFTSMTVSNLTLGRGPTELSPSVALEFDRGTAVGAEVQKLLDAAMKGGTAQVTVGGVTFGSDLQNPVTAFSQISLPLSLPLGALMTNSTGSSSASLPINIPKSGEFGVEKIDGINFGTTDTGIALGAAGVIKNPMPVSVRLGFVSVGVSSERGDKLAQFTVANTSISRGSSPLNIQLNADLGQGPAASQSVASIFNSFMQGQASAVRINNIQFGDSSATAFDFLKSIDTAFPLPFNALAKNGSTTASTGLNLGNLTPKLVNLDFATTPTGVSANLQASLGDTPVPISVNLGFASADINLESTKLATFSTQKINVGSGDNSPNFPLELQMIPMDQKLPAIVASIANPLLSGGQPRGFSAGASKILFGPTPDKAFDILSAVDISMPIPPSVLSSIMGGALSPNANATSSALPLPSLGDTKLATTSTGFTASLNAKFAQPLPLTALLGFANMQVALDDATLTSIAIGKTQLAQSGSLSSSADLKLESGDSAQNKIAAVLNPVIAKLLSADNGTLALNGNVKVSGLTFGAEGAEPNPLLSQVQISMPLAKLASMLPTGSADSPQNTTTSSLPVNASASLALVSTGVSGKVNVASTSSLPITLDIGNFAAKINNNGSSTFCNIDVSQIAFSPSTPGNIGVDLKFATTDFYPKFIENLLASKPSTVIVTGFTFGQPNTPLALFSGIQAPITITRLGNLPTPKVNLIPPSATFNFNNPLPLSVDVGTFSVDGMLGNAKAATINAPKIALKQGPTSVKLGIDLSVGGAFKGLGQLLGGGTIAGANVQARSAAGQDITWITQSFAGQRIALDLGALLKGGGASKFSANGTQSNDFQTVISSFDWTEESRTAMQAAGRSALAKLFGFDDSSST